jgi:hypothetical protein
MAHISKKIEKLLRTNTALFLLCIISIGILVLIWNKSDAESVQVPQARSTDVVSEISMNSQDTEALKTQEIAPAFRGNHDIPSRDRLSI